jgi:hypothetical protein
MIYVVELREQGDPRAWFAFDEADLARKQASMATPTDNVCIYRSDAQAVAAFEGGDPRIAGKEHWRARHALHAQLVALEVLADDC